MDDHVHEHGTLLEFLCEIVNVDLHTLHQVVLRSQLFLQDLNHAILFLNLLGVLLFKGMEQTCVGHLVGVNLILGQIVIADAPLQH